MKCERQSQRPLSVNGTKRYLNGETNRISFHLAFTVQINLFELMNIMVHRSDSKAYDNLLIMPYSLQYTGFIYYSFLYILCLIL